MNIKIFLIILFLFCLSGCKNGSLKPEYFFLNEKVKDIDGNIYHTVNIGTQTWLVENLRVKHYANGDEIPNIVDSTEWINLATGAYCYYQNNTTANAYGLLYNWFAVNDNRGLAPPGWHVASDSEWQTLTDFLGGRFVAGGKLKEADTLHWNPPNIGATNESGFSGLPGGYRSGIGNFDFWGSYGYWWSDSESDSINAWARSLSFQSGYIQRQDVWKTLGVSVRCIKNK